MGKLNKQQRRLKRKRKQNRKDSVAAIKARLQPWEAPKMKLFKMPNLFHTDVPIEKRLEIIRSIGIDAKQKFAEKYLSITDWFRNYDAVYLLSYFAFYRLSHTEGVDPEATGDMDFYHHYIEIMQAFALTQKRAVTAKPMMEEAKKIGDDMLELGRLMQLRLLDFPEGVKEPSDLDSYRLRMEMMQQTTAVRNWAYFHQMQRVVMSLAGAINNRFTAKVGVDAVDFVTMLFKLMDERSDLLNEHRRKLQLVIRPSHHREIIEAYNKNFPENVPIDEGEADRLWVFAQKKKRNLCAMLISHADLKLENIYSFTLDHAKSLLVKETEDKSLRRLLDRLSFGFGELEEHDKEHFILSNPIHARPLIRTDENTYFSAVWGVLPHIVLEMLESLIWEDEELREFYSGIKARFLEDEIEKICRNGFPNGIVLRGSIWNDPKTGKVFENDIIVTIDNFALVIEAKSGTISDPAKRGAPKRLFETLRELIEEPSTQALRFIDFLQGDKRVHSFKTKGGESNCVDSSQIQYYIPLGITFSHLGMIGSNLKKLIKASVVDKKLEELAPSMTFTDFEIVFDLLPREIEKIHYLARRREFEAHMDYEGDEIDLLGFYLDNGFNIGDAEYAKNMILHLGLKSKELDPYIVGNSEGKQVKKPCLAMTQWWSDLLDRTSNKRTPGWIETGFILLNAAKEDQVKFEKMFKELMKRVEAGDVDLKHNWLVLASGPERRRSLIAGYPYTTADKEVRDGVINQIISDEKADSARGIVVIGVRLDRLDYPYTVMARRAATNLFDGLTLAET